MKLSTSTLLIASLLQLWIARGQNSLLVTPASQNLALGDTARFNCAGTGLLISWFINQQILNLNLMASLGITHFEWTADGARHSNISLLATASNNNSEVYCVVYEDAINNDQSDTAVLRVQGLLSSVGNLGVQYGLQDSVLSWDQPFSLPGVPISYVITVTDQTADTDVTSVTVSDTTHQFSSSLWTKCHVYRFRVQAQNGAGAGGVSEIEDLFSGVPETPAVSISNITVTTTASIMLSIEVSQCFLQQNSATLTVDVLDSTGALLKTVLHDQFSMTRFALAMTELQPDSVYSLTVTANNMLGSASTRNITFNTYVVQNIAITESFSNGTTCLECVILSNGMNRGCQITIRQSDQTPCQPSQVDLQLVLPDSTAMSEFTTSYIGCTNQSQTIYRETYSLLASRIDSQERTSRQITINPNGLTCQEPSATTTEIAVSRTLTPPIPSGGVLLEPVAFAYISVAAVAGVLFIVLIIMTIIIVTYVVRRKKNKPVAYTVTASRTRFNGTSVRVEEIPREDPPPVERYTPVPSPEERYSPVQQQEHRHTHALSNGDVQTRIQDNNPWHQRTKEVLDEKPSSHRRSYHHDSRTSGHEEPDENELHEQQRQLQLTIVEEALKFRKENMEKLEYKRPLSGVPTATTGADDEDSDQQDYDHLSDEESDSVFEEGSIPQSRSHQFHTQQQQQQQRQYQHHYRHHQQANGRPQRAHSHYQYSTGQHYTINHHFPHTHNLSRAPHHSSLPKTWHN